MSRTYEEPLSRRKVRKTADPDWADFPSHAGRWWWKPNFTTVRRLVDVAETHAGGRLCKALKMGGSSQCPGYSSWRGCWAPAPPPTPVVYAKPELARSA